MTINSPVVLLGFSCRALAQSMRRSGKTPLVIDCCGDLDTRDAAHEVVVVNDLSDDKTILQTIQRWRHEFGVSAATLAGGAENQPQLLSSIAEIIPDVIAPQQLKRLRDWREWQTWAEQSKIRFPRTSEQAPSTTTLGICSPYLWKPINSAGGNGICAMEDEPAPKSTDPPRTRPGYVAQEYIFGTPVGIAYQSGIDCQILGMTKQMHHNSLDTVSHSKLQLPRDFSYRGSVGPISIPPKFRQRLERFGDIVSAETRIRGAWNADFIFTDDHPVLLEINPRWSAGMELIELHTHLQNLGTTEKCQMIAKRVLYSEDEWEISSEQIEQLRTRQLPHFVSELGNPHCLLGDVQAWCADIPNHGTRFSQGHPVATLFGRGNDEHESLHQLANITLWCREVLCLPAS